MKKNAFNQLMTSYKLNPSFKLNVLAHDVQNIRPVSLIQDMIKQKWNFDILMKIESKSTSLLKDVLTSKGALVKKGEILSLN